MLCITLQKLEVEIPYSNKYMIPDLKGVETETPEYFTFNLSRVYGDVLEVSLDDFIGSSDVYDTYSKFSPIQIGACD